MEKVNNNKQIYFQKCCPQHSNYPLDIILIQKQVQDNLICFKCMQDGVIPHQQFIHTKEILNLSDDSIIQNFPPLEDQNISTFLNKFSKQNQLGLITQQINNYFDQLKKQLISIIDKMQNETKLKISSLVSLKEQVMEVYNTISAKQDLKNLFNTKDNDDIIIHSKIKLIIEDKFNNISTNTQKIKEKIDNYTALEDTFCIEVPQKVQQSVEEMLNKIDFFSYLDLSIFKDYVQKTLNKQTPKQTQNPTNTVNILELIKNPTNYCSKEYIKKIEQIFNKYEYILNQIQIEGSQYEKEKQNIFSNLTLNQLENVRVLSQKIQSIEKNMNQNQQNNQLKQNIQINSNIILEILQNQFIDKHELNLLLQKYPIFDLMDQIYFSNIKSINFIRSSSYGDSQNLIITRGINYEIEIQKAIQQTHAISFSNFILDPKKKYIFRIQIKTNIQTDTFINIGLIQEQNKNTTQIQNNGLTYIERGDYKGISKSIKGGNVFEGKKENINKVIEMRIDLQNKILKVANYPNYDNVAELDDKTKIEDSQQYRLAAQLYYLDHKIIITNFEIVDTFDDKM